MNADGLDPKTLIRETLAERCARNPRYSLRAFAKATGISHTVLSLVLSGKRKLSKRAAAKLADHLELDPESREKLLKPSRQETSVDERYRQLSADVFKIISDWQHYAILSALSLPAAKFEPRWIARATGITTIEASLAMERLRKVGLVEKARNGRWRQAGKPFYVGNTESTEATRTFHKRLVGKAIESLDHVPREMRDYSSMTFAVDPSLVAHAAERIRAFRRELVEELEAKGKPREVYHLTIQLFPSKNLTQLSENKES
jgi:uncharacterized protein (TIGR02147 family)